MGEQEADLGWFGAGYVQYFFLKLFVYYKSSKKKVFSHEDEWQVPQEKRSIDFENFESSTKSKKKDFVN